MTDIAGRWTGGPRPRSGVGQALVIVLVGALVFLGGSVLYSVLLLGPVYGSPVAAFLLSPQLFIWAILVVVIGVIGRRWRPGAAAAWALCLPLPATVVGILIANPATVTQGAALLLPPFLILVLWWSAGLFGAAVVGVLAGLAYRHGVRVTVRTAAGAASLAMLSVGGVAAFALPALWFTVYFRIWGAPVVVTSAQADRYLLLAGVALGGLVLASLAAIIARRRGLMWLTGAALAFAVIAALIFQVPQGRFLPADTDPEPYNTTFVGCHSGSDDCPGG